jgi:serine protease
VRVVREGTVGFSADAGTQFVLLVDEDTGENAAVQPVEASDGDYGFRFTNVPDGRYGIVAGSDNDWDGLICDAGETCGGYPTFANPQVIEIAGQDETGLDFPLNLVGGSNTQARSRSVSAGAGLNRE